MVIITWITVVILELIHAPKPDFLEGCIPGAFEAVGGLKRLPPALHLLADRV